MSIRFKKIFIKNFLSYGNNVTEFDLERTGTTFIMGKDLDDLASGTKGNGCGKTAILNALVFALYDKPVSNISKENLVNNVNKKNMEVTVEFEKGDTNYAVRRIRKGKTGASVHLFEGDKDITPDSIKMTNIAIEKILAYPYELFVRIVAYSATHTPFLDLPASSGSYANQRDIIEELFELKTLSERAATLKEIIKATEQDFKMKDAHIHRLKEEHKRHNALIDAAKARVLNWEQDKKDEIKSINKQLKKTEGINIDEQRELHEKLSEYDGLCNKAHTQQRELERKMRLMNNTITAAEEELEHLRKAECPYCGQEYHDNKGKIEEKTATSAHAMEAYTEFEQQATANEDLIKQLEAERVEVSDKITVHNIKELIDIRGNQDQLKARLKHLEEGENPHVETLKDLEVIKLEDIDTSELDDLAEEINHQKFLHKILTKNDSFVRKTLLNKNIPFLNKRLAMYLDTLGLPHSVRFTEAMTVQISRFGRLLDFGNLSNGQQARLNFAISLAFRDMLENVHGKINVFMLDEVLDVGLDSVGIQAAAKLLKDKSRDEKLSVFIISHKDELSNAFENKLYVTMKKGFSYIEEL